MLSLVSKLKIKNVECRCSQFVNVSARTMSYIRKSYDHHVKPANTSNTRILCGVSAYNIHRIPPKNFAQFQLTRNFSSQSIVEFQQRLYMAISESKLVGIFQDTLLNIHSATGMPWWATIIVSAVLMRSAVTVPLAVYQSYILAKVENIGLEMADIAKEVHRETAIAQHQYHWSEKRAATVFKIAMKRQWSKLIIRDNCHPFKASVLIWFQIPMWISLSFALRNLVFMRPAGDLAAQVTFTELTVGGFGWIPNLTLPDHSWILPVALGIINLSIIELQVMSKLRKPSKMQTFFTNFFRVFSVVMVPISAAVPSCMCLYWVSSSAYGLVQNIVLMSPKVKRKCGVPITPSELEHPYRQVYSEFKERVSSIPGLKKKY